MKGYVLQRERRFDEAHEIYNSVIDIGTELRDFNMITRAMIHDTEIYLMEGQLRAAESAYHALLRLVADEKQEHLLNVGIAYGELSILQFEQNQLNAAARQAALCIERCDHVIPHYALVGHAILARIHRLNGDINVCQRAVQNMLDILENFAAVPGRIYVLFVTRLWIHDALFARFSQFMMEQRHLSISPYEAELLQLVAIRVCIDERTDSALAEAFLLIEDLRSKLEGSSFIASRIQLSILEALALDAADRTGEALKAVEAALTLAEPEGYLRIFVDEGVPMAVLLRQIRARGEYVTKLLAAFDSGATAASATPSGQPILGDIEPSSERELEVLRLIADGASNREIAEALFVSIGTVKKYLNNIFLKLDVHNRTQATATARQHNLL